MTEWLWVVNGRQVFRVLLTSFVVLFLAGALLADDENNETTQEGAKEESKEEAKEETIASHQRWVTSLAYSPNGSILATAGGESLQYRPGDVKLWDTRNGKLIASLEGHSSNVWSVAFSPDGKTLVASGYDGKVILWNVDEKKSLATLEKHKGWCRAVAYHPAGKH